MPANRVGIIFHGIGEPSRELEEGEAPFWIDISRFEFILDRIGSHPGAAMIDITFDDGNISDYEIALPCLKARGMRGQFFVLSGRIGKRGSLGARHIRSLMEQGMAIGSHGIAHVDWSRLGPADLARELVESRSALQELGGVPVAAAAIPFGKYNARVIRFLKKAGYEVAYSSDLGMMDETAFLRPRTSITAAMTDEDIARVLSGDVPAGRRLRRKLGMLKRRYFPRPHASERQT